MTVILTKTKYDHGVRNLGAFMGSNGLITRKSDGKTVEINRAERGSLLKIKVKNYNSILTDDEELRQLSEANLSESEIEATREMCVTDWWDEAKDEIVPRAGFEGCYQEGRSGGWCVIEGTELLSEYFNQGAYSAYDCDPEDPFELHELRERFLDLAFELVENIDYCIENFAGLIREQVTDNQRELERKRAESIVLGYN